MHSQRRLEFLLGEKLARAYLAGECYVANVRCAQTDADRYWRDVAGALEQWIEAMRACVAESDAEPTAAAGSTALSGPSLP